MLGPLREHWQLKVLALAFSVALWLFVSSGDKGEAVFSVPLELVERPPGLEVTAMGAETVVVRVEGLRRILARVRDEDLGAEVSLRGLPAGRFAVRIRPQDVRTPRGVKVMWITPTLVRGTLEPPPASR
jgi:hypothetical protein